MEIIILIAWFIIKVFVSWRAAEWACYRRRSLLLHFSCYMMTWLAACKVQEWVVAYWRYP
jgi:hypothetical protein